MVIFNRLRWIPRQASVRDIYIAISRARDLGKVKYKFVVAPAIGSNISAAHSLVVYTMLDALIMNLDSVSAMDRGHKHSDGSSVISLWLQLRNEGRYDSHEGWYPPEGIQKSPA